MSTVRSVFASFLAPLAFVSLVFAVSGANAQDAKVETAAKALQKKAIQSDYLGTDFAKAKAKLEKAIADCGTDKCGAPLRAQLQRDLGTVLVGGAVDVPAGIKAFQEALKLDPKIELDPDLKTGDIEKAFEKAKSGGGGDKGGDEKPAVAGDFAHTPVAEQAIRTPLPIYAEYTGSEALTRVIARYRAPGMGEWKTLELKKIDKGWGAELACLDVQPGVISYYLQGFNSENDPVASGGDRNTPFKTEIKQSITGDKPHLPGQQPSNQCADTGDCPPGFPGCKGAGSEGLLKEADVPCEEASECKSNKCDAGKCTAPETKSKYKKVWIGGEVMADFVFLPGAQNVCSLDTDTALPANDGNYYCTDDAGKDFPARPSEDDRTGTQNRSIDPDKANSINGGPAFSKFRILASFDYAPTEFVMLGARVGIALPLGYPGTEAKFDGQKAAAPWLHLEARATFVLGKDGIGAIGAPRPYVYGAFGLGAYDASVSGVKVRLNNADGTNDDRDLKAYKLQGQAPLFVALGGGVRYAFSERAAFLGGIRGTLGIGGGIIPGLAPDLAVQFGF